MKYASKNAGLRLKSSRGASTLGGLSLRTVMDDSTDLCAGVAFCVGNDLLSNVEGESVALLLLSPSGELSVLVL